MTKLINGPINYAELTGVTNGVEKHITFFMDIHNSLDNQTRCESFDSIDIAQYLYKIIKEATCPIDFFIEIKKNNINEPLTNKRNIYIEEVMEMFKSEFVIKKESNRNLVKYAKSNPNVRLHYLDIRDHFNIFKLMKIVDNKIKTNLKLLFETHDPIYKNKIIEYLKKVNDDITNLKTILSDALSNSNNYNKNENQDKYYMDKIFNRIEDKKLKQNINTFITGYFNRILQIFDELIEELNLEINQLFQTQPGQSLYNFNSACIKHVEKKVDFLYEMIIDLYSIFTDGFLLRRILDKNYVRKSIVYSGSQHAINCIGFLVKFCGFKITKVHLSEIKDLDQLMDKISNTEYVYNIYKYFHQKAKEYTQCVKYDDYLLNMLPHTCKI